MPPKASITAQIFYHIALNCLIMFMFAEEVGGEFKCSFPRQLLMQQKLRKL